MREGVAGRDLPRPTTSFVGREEELRRLGRIVVGGRLVTLHGPGGAGKTRLSLEMAARAGEHFPDGIHFADLAGLDEPELVPRVVATAAHVRERPGQEALSALTSGLGPRRALLILDNCEHLLDACRLVAGALLETCPAVALVATSREPLGLPPETVCPRPRRCGSLRGPPIPRRRCRPTTPPGCSWRAPGAPCPDWSFSPSDADLVVRICRRLDGLPLAIELAASRLRSSRWPRSTSGWRTASACYAVSPHRRRVPPRQRTLRATIDWSYGLLDEPERCLLRRLSVFAGGFGLDSVEAVCAGGGVGEEDVLDLVAGLVDKSLVVRGEHADRARHRLLDSVRDFAVERCAQHEDLDMLRSRHFGHFLAMASPRGRRAPRA